MWQKSEQNTEALRTTWEQMHHEGLVLRDTTWKKVVVFQYDTVYRTMVYRATVERPFPANSLIKMQEDSGVLLTGKTANVENPPGLANSLGQATAAIDQATTPKENFVGQKTDVYTKAGDFEALPLKTTLLKTPEKRYDWPEADVATLPKKAKHTPRPSVLIPRQFRIGAGGGVLIPGADKLSGKSGFSTSLIGEIVFSDQLALSLEGAYSGISFKGSAYDEALGLPPLPSPGDDYKLQYFELEEGLKPILQLTAGMRYWFWAKHQCSPYLGLGYAMQWHPGFELKAEFHNDVTGKEKEKSLEVPSLDKPVSLLNINAGIRYRFWRQLYWQTGTTYAFKIDPRQAGIPRYWGISSGVLFGF